MIAQMLYKRVLGKIDIFVFFFIYFCSQFETQAGKLKRKYWWRNCKMWIILGIVATVVLVIIIISVTTGSKNSADDNEDNPGLA